MNRPSIYWLITDTHWQEKLTIFGRPPNSDELIIKNLKYFLCPQDILIHLGDVISYNHAALNDILKYIECKTKILVRGNHDNKTDNWYLNNGFDFVCEEMRCQDIVLSHYPVPTDKINVHGHFHNGDWRKHEPHFAEFYGNNHKLFALEFMGYKPLNIKEIDLLHS